MKRVLAISFLFVFLIAYITPITSVHATEVTWGDNNSTYFSDEEFYTARQLATLDIITQLCSNGVNELTIDNATSVDDYIINFLEFVDDNAGNAVSDIYDVCNQLKNEIDSKANEIGTAFKSIGEDLNNSFNDLIDWFDSLDTVKKVEYKSNPSIVPLINRLSRINNNNTPTPSPDPDFSYINYINTWYLTNQNASAYVDFFDTSTHNFVMGWNPYTPMTINGNLRDYTWVCSDFNGMRENNHTQLGLYKYATSYSPLMTIYLNTQSDNTVEAIYSASTYTHVFNGTFGNPDRGGYLFCYDGSNVRTDYSNSYSYTQSTFAGLSTAINYIYQHYCNINLYVDGQLWALVGTNNTNITINVKGMDFYGNKDKDPITYYYPNGTQIDYKKLYDVIKRAIDNSTCIDNQTIWEGDTYYDSHDNVYSPTIYNYYSDDDNESESDVLEDIINLAIIPKFDTALLQPIEEPITNGEKIMFLGVQSLPEDILFVIGAGFVLILFGAMINRLIE